MLKRDNTADAEVNLFYLLFINATPKHNQQLKINWGRTFMYYTRWNERGYTTQNPEGRGAFVALDYAHHEGDETTDF